GVGWLQRRRTPALGALVLSDSEHLPLPPVLLPVRRVARLGTPPGARAASKAPSRPSGPLRGRHVDHHGSDAVFLAPAERLRHVLLRARTAPDRPPVPDAERPLPA